MARVSRANPSVQGEPEEYKVNVRRARAVRAEVGDQIRWAITHQDMTGSKDLTVRRIQEWAKAELEGDPFVLRAALAELASAAAAQMVHLDLTSPALVASEPRRRVESAAS